MRFREQIASHGLTQEQAQRLLTAAEQQFGRMDYKNTGYSEGTPEHVCELLWQRMTKHDLYMVLYERRPASDERPDLNVLWEQHKAASHKREGLAEGASNPRQDGGSGVVTLTVELLGKILRYIEYLEREARPWPDW